MKYHNTIFNQLLNMLPGSQFEQDVAREQRNRHTKHFTVWNYTMLWNDFVLIGEIFIGHYWVYMFNRKATTQNGKVALPFSDIGTYSPHRKFVVDEMSYFKVSYIYKISQNPSQWECNRKSEGKGGRNRLRQRGRGDKVACRVLSGTL